MPKGSLLPWNWRRLHEDLCLVNPSQRARGPRPVEGCNPSLHRKRPKGQSKELNRKTLVFLQICQNIIFIYFLPFDSFLLILVLEPNVLVVRKWEGKFWGTTERFDQNPVLKDSCVQTKGVANSLYWRIHTPKWRKHEGSQMPKRKLATRGLMPKTKRHVRLAKMSKRKRNAGGKFEQSEDAKRELFALELKEATGGFVPCESKPACQRPTPSRRIQAKLASKEAKRPIEGVESKNTCFSPNLSKY